MRSYTNVNKSAPKSAKYICSDNTNGSFPDNKQGIPNIFNKIQRSLQSHYIEVAQGDIFMEQKMRFGLVLAILKKQFGGRL